MLEDSLTVARYQALQRVWADYPPLMLTVAGFLGIKPKGGKRKRGGKKYGDLSELVSLFPTGQIK